MSSIGEFREGSAPPHRLRAFTEKLTRELHIGEPVKHQEEEEGEPVLGCRESGQILWYNDSKYFGFIQRDAGGSIFVHEGEIDDVPWHMRNAGTSVNYTIVKNTRRPGRLMAGNVALKLA